MLRIERMQSGTWCARGCLCDPRARRIAAGYLLGVSRLEGVTAAVAAAWLTPTKTPPIFTSADRLKVLEFACTV